MKKPIALLVTDTHLSEHNIDLVTDIWKQAIDECKRLEINQIFFLGDFFHSRKGQPLSVLKAGQNIVEMLKISKIHVKAICGNHDKASYLSADSFIDIFHSDNFEVINEPDAAIYDDMCIKFLPYFKEGSDILKEYITLCNKWNKRYQKNILLTHIAINGSITNDNEHISNCIPSSEFSNFDTVFTGHFHARQEFENIVYIGSAYQANYGEDSNKGFTVLYSDGSYEFTRSKFPEYRKYTLDVSDISEKELTFLIEEKEEGHNIRLEIVGESEKLKSFNRSIFSDIGLDTVLKPNEAIESLSECQTTTYDKKSLKNAFIDFCDENKVEDREYGLEKIDEI